MAYKDKEKLKAYQKKYQAEYIKTHRAERDRAVSRHRRKMKSPENFVSEVVVDVINPAITSRGMDKESLLATLRAKTSGIINDEPVIILEKPKEPSQMTVEPFYG